MSELLTIWLFSWRWASLPLDFAEVAAVAADDDFLTSSCASFLCSADAAAARAAKGQDGRLLATLPAFVSAAGATAGVGTISVRR